MLKSGIVPAKALTITSASESKRSSRIPGPSLSDVLSDVPLSSQLASACLPFRARMYDSSPPAAYLLQPDQQPPHLSFGDS